MDDSVGISCRRAARRENTCQDQRTPTHPTHVPRDPKSTYQPGCCCMRRYVNLEFHVTQPGARQYCVATQAHWQHREWREMGRSREAS